jgi:hypothetical protein
MARKRGYVPYKIQRALNGGRGGLLSHTEEADLGRGAQSGDGEAPPAAPREQPAAGRLSGQGVSWEEPSFRGPYSKGEHRAHACRKILSSHPQGVACAYVPLSIEIVGTTGCERKL